MTSRTRRLGAVVAAGVLASPAASFGVATGAEAQARIDPAAMKVVGDCKGGTGKIGLTVLPIAEDTYQITVKARRVLEDSRWRAELFAFSYDADDGSGAEDNQTFRPRATNGSWSFTTEVDLTGGGPQVTFGVDARTSDDGGDITCLIGSSPARPVAGYSLCAREIHFLSLRQRGDDKLVVRHAITAGAADTRWRLELKVFNSEESRSVAFNNVSNKHGVVRSRVELTAVPEDSRFTVRALNERGGHCYIQVDPGPLTAEVTGSSVSPLKSLLR